MDSRHFASVKQVRIVHQSPHRSYHQPELPVVYCVPVWPGRVVDGVYIPSGVFDNPSLLFHPPQKVDGLRGKPEPNLFCFSTKLGVGGALPCVDPT